MNEPIWMSTAAALAIDSIPIESVDVPGLLADMLRERADLRQQRDEARSQLAAVAAATKHPHKGPNDTDMSMLLAAAKRLDGGYDAGGSNNRQTVARVLRAVVAVVAPVSDSAMFVSELQRHEEQR